MSKVIVVDIAHQQLDAPDVESVLNSTLKQVQLSSRFRAIRIHHGFGGRNEEPSLKSLVHNWIFANKDRLKCAIQHHGIETFGKDVAELAADCDVSIRDDFGFATESSTVVWVK